MSGCHRSMRLLRQSQGYPGSSHTWLITQPRHGKTRKCQQKTKQEGVAAACHPPGPNHCSQPKQVHLRPACCSALRPSNTNSSEVAITAVQTMCLQKNLRHRLRRRRPKTGDARPMGQVLLKGSLHLASSGATVYVTVQHCAINYAPTQQCLQGHNASIAITKLTAEHSHYRRTMA